MTLLPLSSGRLRSTRRSRELPCWTLLINRNGTDVFSMGAWAANRELGIRHYKYSTNSTVNPSTYKILDKPA